MNTPKRTEPERRMEDLLRLRQTVAHCLKVVEEKCRAEAEDRLRIAEELRKRRVQ